MVYKFVLVTGINLASIDRRIFNTLKRASENGYVFGFRIDGESLNIKCHKVAEGSDNRIHQKSLAESDRAFIEENFREYSPASVTLH